ncbi:MAG: hypothetical protein ACE5DR_02755 [Thermodesulfobacteriota bacterium]
MSRVKDITRHDRRRMGRFHTLLGAVITIMGLFWLAHKLGWIPAANGGPQVFWPILTIIVGLWVVYGSSAAKALRRMTCDGPRQ